MVHTKDRFHSRQLCKIIETKENFISGKRSNLNIRGWVRRDDKRTQ